MMSVTTTEPVQGVLINKNTIANQGILKVELEFNLEGEVIATFVARDPDSCLWKRLKNKQISLDAWKLI